MNLLPKLTSVCIVIIAFTLFGCSSPTTEELGEKYKNQAIALQGITFDADENQPLNQFFLQEGYDGLTSSEFLRLVGPTYKESENTNDISVIVDMSAGLNIGIKESYEVMKELVSNLDPGLATINYYHADEEDELQPMDFINSISDAIELQNPANFKKQYSKLRSAMEHATENNERITVFVTDFLLDEGDAITSRRFKDGVYRSGETADNTTWAKSYFEKWFLDNNTVTVYPYQYSASNYYNKSENKYIYYIVFIPEYIRNNDVDMLLRSFEKIMGNGYNFSPSDIHAEMDVSNLTGCNESYPLLKNQNSNPHATSNPLIPTIPFSHDALMTVSPEELVAACNIDVENNTPFSIRAKVKTVDLSNMYYAAITKEKSLLDTESNLLENLEPVDDLYLRSSESDVYSLYFDKQVQRVNYMTGYQGYDKLLGAGIIATRNGISPMPKELAWDFESKFGTMANDALSESIRLGLNQYINAKPEKHLSTIIFPIHGN